MKTNNSYLKGTCIVNIRKVFEVNKKDLDDVIIIMLTGGIKSLKKNPYIELTEFEDMRPVDKYPAQSVLEAIAKINNLVADMKKYDCSTLKIVS